MRAVITVIGKDMVGILAKVSTECSNHNINVLEVTQSILQDLFAMIMMVDFSKSDLPFTEFSDMLGKMGNEMGLSIHVMHEDIFNAMHTI
ncbi:MAG: ACT domain-containing protein [Acutalibacteraceae bacterium]|nr:ACT domain-containing protein [Acutalibacteraceae bacterium]